MPQWLIGDFFRGVFVSVRDILSKCYEAYGDRYFIVLICCAALAILLLFNGREGNWISSMPENYMIVGRSFTTDLNYDEIKKISEEYFADKGVRDFNISKFKKKGMFSVEYMVERTDNRDLSTPLLEFLNTKD